LGKIRQTTKQFILLFRSPLIVLLLIEMFISCTDPTDAGDWEYPKNDTIKQYSYQIINTFPHDTLAFTQGLVYHNGYLYESTGLYGQSSLRKVDLVSGEILQQINLSNDYFGEGISIFNNSIYQLTWLSRKGFIYTLSDFDSIGQFTYNRQGWGLTHDSSRFILSDGSASLHFLNLQTLEMLSSIPVVDNNGPVINLNELEYIDGSVYANVWYTDRIVIIKPETGKVIGNIDLSGLLSPEDINPDTNVLNGIAFDQQNSRLFVTGKLWPKLFEIELIEVTLAM
jgi:glutamine cyclotransferase